VGPGPQTVADTDIRLEGGLICFPIYQVYFFFVGETQSITKLDCGKLPEFPPPGSTTEGRYTLNYLPDRILIDENINKNSIGQVVYFINPTSIIVGKEQFSSYQPLLTKLMSFITPGLQWFPGHFHRRHFPLGEMSGCHPEKASLQQYLSSWRIVRIESTVILMFVRDAFSQDPLSSIWAVQPRHRSCN